MGYHLVAQKNTETVSLVIGGTILVDMDEDLPQIATWLAKAGWLGAQYDILSAATAPFDYHIHAFDKWCESLDSADYEDLLPVDANIHFRFLLDPFDPATTPRGPKPSMSSSGRPLVHGHLPFTGHTTQGTVFFRAEPFPRSRAIDPKGGRVSAGQGLYGFPPSECPFIPTGFAAVGRYALPNVAPSIFRWELRPPANILYSAGASVPLFGQAGGGVEICIEADFDNVGHIANPVVLPSM
jgi:hypothetical protein